jgi:hypothetical protein
VPALIAVLSSWQLSWHQATNAWTSCAQAVKNLQYPQQTIVNEAESMVYFAPIMSSTQKDATINMRCIYKPTHPGRIRRTGKTTKRHEKTLGRHFEGSSLQRILENGPKEQHSQHLAKKSGRTRGNRGCLAGPQLTLIRARPFIHPSTSVVICTIPKARHSTVL